MTPLARFQKFVWSDAWSNSTAGRFKRMVRTGVGALSLQQPKSTRTTLFLSFGVNDGWNISPHAIDSVFRKIAGWSTVPDLILLTNMDINPSYKELGTAGSLHAASYERTLAENGGAFYQIHNLPEIGLIDIGRLFSEAILGFDPASQYLTRDPAYRNWQSETLSAGTFGGRPGAGYLVTTETAGDLDIRVLFSKSAQDLLAPAASQLLIGLSRGGRQFVSVKDQNGVLVATYVDEDTTSSICDNRVSVTANGKKLFQFEIDVNGSHVALLLQGAPACDLIVPRFAAPFQAFIVVLNNQEAVGTKLTFPSAPAVGTMQSFQPIIRGSECWGTKPFAAGGNGINHLASPCSSLIAQAISSLNFN